MSQIPPDPADPAYTDLLETFMAFPAPLALVDANGYAERVNLRFLQRFGANGVNAARLRDLIKVPQGAWQSVDLSPSEAGGKEVRARAARTADHILLVADEPAGAERELEVLRTRIGELERFAATDHLTGAWNRGHLNLIIEPERARSLARRRPLTLLLFDIDHFNKINDSFGHAVGDSVLGELAKLVRNRIRASDLLFRRGDDRFMVLASSGYSGAERMAESLRQAVAGHAFEGAGTLTISLGVAEHYGDEDTPTWFHRLDEALSQAKATGRNCVVVSRQGNSDAWAAEGGGSALHLVWEESYECGDPTIDAEHRELFQLANILIDAALPEREDAGAVRAALSELLAHVVRHFADEEAILERLNFAQLPEHRQAHEGLLQRARMMARLLNEGKSGPGGVIEFLAQDVVARHMLVVDRAFFPMFRNAAP